MFFVLSKTLGIFCFPLPVVFLLLLLSAVFRKRRPKLGWALFWVGLGMLYLFSTAPVRDLLMGGLEAPFRDPALPPATDAIVVLGGCADLALSTTERLVLSSSADRFVEGVALTRRFPDAVLIFSGGTGSVHDQTRKEAPLLAAGAMRLGVPQDRIIPEPNSRNTYEIAVETKRILEQRHLRSFVLVTSASHMKRALGCFRKVGLEPIPDAVDFRGHVGGYTLWSLIPDVGNLEQAHMALKEYAGLAVYRVKGYN